MFSIGPPLQNKSDMQDVQQGKTRYPALNHEAALNLTRIVVLRFTYPAMSNYPFSEINE